jgi:ABC-type transport system involved in multi-copper enzyme maturation permease subunit
LIVRPVIEIALATFREARRNRILYSVLFFALVILMSSFLVGEVTIHSADRILQDIGLGAVHVFGAIIAIFLSVTMVNREIERRTLYTVIAKPVSRAQFVVGKAFGVWLTLLVAVLIMGAALVLEMAFYGARVESQLFWALLGVVVQLFIVAAFGVFTSTFTSPALSAFFCLSFLVLGNTSHDVRFFASKSASSFVRAAGEWLYVVLPDLRRLNYSVEATHFLPINTGMLGYSLAYGALWMLCFVAMGVVVFSRRDLK